MLDADGALYTENLRGARGRQVRAARHGASRRSSRASPSTASVTSRSPATRGTPPRMRAEALTLRHAPDRHVRMLRTRCSISSSRTSPGAQRGNFLTIPTDCPQRDERLGWTGDAQASPPPPPSTSMSPPSSPSGWSTSTTRSWPRAPSPTWPPLAGFRSGGSAGWADAGVIVPVDALHALRRRRLLADNYAGMARCLDYLVQPTARDCIRSGGRYGDWVALRRHAQGGHRHGLSSRTAPPDGSAARGWGRTPTPSATRSSPRTCRGLPRRVRPRRRTDRGRHADRLSLALHFDLAARERRAAPANTSSPTSRRTTDTSRPASSARRWPARAHAPGAPSSPAGSCPATRIPSWLFASSTARPRSGSAGTAGRRTRRVPGPPA